jgi:hypothetical protein
MPQLYSYIRWSSDRQEKGTTMNRQVTPYLRSFEEESGVKYQYNVKSGLSYKDTVGLRLQINRVDSGLDVHVADLDYYWLQERGSMCQLAYRVLDRSQ